MKTLYSHLIAKDPLVQFFSEVNSTLFPNSSIPVINLQQGPNESICTALNRLKWEELTDTLYQARSADGRMVIIAKGKISPAPQPTTYRTQGPNGEVTEHTLEHTDKRLFVYIERFSPRDFGRSRKLTVEQQSRFATIEEYIHAIFRPFRGNSFSTFFLNGFQVPLSEKQRAQMKPKHLADPEYMRVAESMNVEANCRVVCGGSISGAAAFEILAQLQP